MIWAVPGGAELEAYAILSGGGAWAAAHVGALKAAKDLGIKFLGYGGTSGGAIVASLAAVGVAPEKMRDLLKSTLHPRNILSEAGQQIESYQADLGDVFALLKNPGLSSIFRAGSRFVTNADFRRMTGEVASAFGLERISGIGAALEEAATESRIISKGEPLTFGLLRERANVELKVLATNLSKGRSEIFSPDQTPNEKVAAGVSASAAYPFLIQPVQSSRNRELLVDGGLCSNTPTFLFLNDAKRHRVPIIVFQLERERSSFERPNINSLEKYVEAALDIAVNASDRLRDEDASPLIYTVRVPIPATFRPMSLGLDHGQVDLFFEGGYERARERLVEWPAFKAFAEHAEDEDELAWRLIASYGPRKIFENVLRAIGNDLFRFTSEKGRISTSPDLRISLWLPILDTDRRVRLVLTYSHGFGTDHEDQSLVFGEQDGIVGRCFQTGSFAADDLERLSSTAQPDPTNGRVPEGRRAVLAFPIRAGSDIPPHSRSRPVAVCAIDAMTPLEDTGWLTRSSSTNQLFSRELTVILSEWESVLKQLLRA